MFEHYLSNKNEGATVALKSKFRELNEGLHEFQVPRWFDIASRRFAMPMRVAFHFVSNLR